MRKVTEQVVKAFLDSEYNACGNTSTDGQSLWLHGHKIARKTDEGIEINNCGYQTNVTKERLNGILRLGVFRFPVPRIFQKNFRWYLATGHNPAAEFPCNVWVNVESELDKAQKLDHFLNATVKGG